MLSPIQSSEACAGSAAEVRLANGRTAAVSANTGAVTKINRYTASRIERIKIQFSVLSGPRIAARNFK